MVQRVQVAPEGDLEHRLPVHLSKAFGINRAPSVADIVLYSTRAVHKKVSEVIKLHLLTRSKMGCMPEELQISYAQLVLKHDREVVFDNQNVSLSFLWAGRRSTWRRGAMLWNTQVPAKVVRFNEALARARGLITPPLGHQNSVR
eukprot:6262925-Amphidinium_carterae.1